jgi:hypothetical protein
MTKLELEKIIEDKLAIAKKESDTLSRDKDVNYDYNLGKATGKLIAYNEILDLLDDLWVIDY